MTFVPRLYEEIVRDLLTTMTGGTVQESLTVPPGNDPILLHNRPVRRVSHLEGVTAAGTGGNTGDGIAYRFTAADFELVATNGNPDERDAIRFREGGRRPVPGTSLVVNYYPVQTDPVPLTDLNVGSVVRTMMETFGRELAQSNLQLEHIYESAFLETATNGSLDRVVALVGIRRIPTGHPVVRMRFTRRLGTPGRITVPVATPVTDAAGNRYLTLSDLTLEPGESTREVLASGENPGTEPVEEGGLDRLEALIAGISEVTNPQPARRLAAPETDDELRRRARGALHGVVRGTVDALRFGLLSIPEVKDVAIIEAPNGVPGEIQIDVAYEEETPTIRELVQQRVDELRPAGIRVVIGQAVRRRLNVRVALTLAGSTIPDAELASLTRRIEDRLANHFSGIAPGGKVRRAKLLSLVLEDAQVVDANVILLPAGEAEMEELTLQSGEVLDVIRPFSFLPTAFESAPGGTAAVLTMVSAILPLHVLAGVTATQAAEAINLALDTYLRSRGPEAPLTVDSLVAAIRDDTRFALVRRDILVTVETADGRFVQLTDGVGEHPLAGNESLQKDAIDLDVRDGMI